MPIISTDSANSLSTISNKYQHHIIMKKLLFSITLCLFYITQLQAQTFHAIVFCNTIDESIGQSMTTELSNVARNMGILESLLEDDYYFITSVIDGKNCSRDYIKRLIDNMEVGPDDVIFTFYGGHGSHAPNNADDPWPQYCMNTGNQNLWLPMAQLDKWLASKNPRLRVIVSNCCNKEQDFVTIKPMWATNERATKMDTYNAEPFRKLFSQRGRIMSTSSKLGQYSWCNGYGGVFTNQFWDAMDKLGQGKISPTWNSLLETASQELNIQTKEGIVKQTPYYDIRLNEPKDRVRTPRPTETTLAQALAKLTDKSIGQNTRLAMIPEIRSKYFNNGSMVITVASDMTTAVDYENAADFLNRICLSPYIKGITILNDDINRLKVHELR